MNVFGLTGGIGTGKSTAAGFLARHGLRVVDTDVLARDVVAPGEPALHEIISAFGPEVIGGDGRLLRERLAAIVFADPAKRRHLEAILHPRIRALWMARLEQWRCEGVPVAVVVIPLLFETDAQARFDAVICTACSAPTQRERLATRGWSVPEVEQRLAAQWPLDRKIAAANFVVWTEGGLDVHERQLERIFLAPG